MRRWPLLTSGKRLEDVKEVFERIVGYSGISHGDGYHNSRGSPWDASSAAGGWRRLPDHWNVAGSPALSASGTPRVAQREADAHPSNRRRHTDSGLRIRHGGVLLELDASAVGGGAVLPRGELRPRRSRLERSDVRAAHGTADCAGVACTLGCGGCAWAIRSRWALFRRLCQQSVRTPISRSRGRHGAGGFDSPRRMGKSDPEATEGDQSGLAIRLDSRLARTTGFSAVLP